MDRFRSRFIKGGKFGGHSTQRREHGFGVHRLRHDFGLAVNASRNVRNIAAQFLDQLDQLGDFLLSCEIYLQFQRRAILRITLLASLRDQHQRTHDGSVQPDRTL